MESLATDLVKSLAVQGTGWILFLLAAIACFWLLRKLLSAQADCQKIGETLSEKRLEEAKEAMRILNEGTQANIKLAENLEQRTQTFQTVAQLVQQMRDAQTTGLAYWQERVSNIEKTMSRIEERLQKA